MKKLNIYNKYMQMYEITWILNSNNKDFNLLIKNYSNFIEEYNGKIINIENLGIKKFSYIINNERNGRYIYIDINLNRKIINKLKNEFELNDNILRSLIIKKDNFIKNDEMYNLINYKNIDFIKKFISDNCKIMSRKNTKLKSKLQRKLSREIKRSRFLGFIGYTDNHLI